MQIKHPLNDRGEESHGLTLHKPSAGDDAADFEHALHVRQMLEEGERRLTDIRARVLSGAYHSLEMAEQVARAILRSGDVALLPYE